MAVLAPWRRRGVGSALPRAVLHDAPKYLFASLWPNAQCSAEGFYDRAGFATAGPVFEDAGIPHRLMRYRPKEDR